MSRFHAGALRSLVLAGILAAVGAACSPAPNALPTVLPGAGESAPASADATGGPASSLPSGAITDPAEAWPAFAACLRSHGLQVADPEVDANGDPSWTGGDFKKLITAQIQTDCNPIIAAVNEAGGKGRQRPSYSYESQVAHADCMREHGLADWPDPDPNDLSAGMPAGYRQARPDGVRGARRLRAAARGDDGLAVAGPVMRRSIVVTGVAVVVAVAGAGLVLSQLRAAGGSPAGSTSPSATRLVPVVRTTLLATQPVSGQVTSAQTWTIATPTGPAPDEVAAAADAVAAARDELATARSALTAAARTRVLVEARDDAAVAAAPAGAARRDAVRTRALDRIAQAGAVSMARGAVNAARRGLAAANRQLAARQSSETAAAGTVTMLPAVGARVARGEPIYALDGRPVVLLVGTTPAYRAIREGDVGPDVKELQENLVALGFGGTPAIRTDGTFDHATTLAVRRWQTAGHLDPSGIVRLGDTVVLPAEVRVSAAHVAVGGGAQPGAPMLDVASVDEVVKVVVDPGLAPSVHVGDPIRFSGPRGTDIPGSVVSVGAPAPSTEDGPNGPAGLLQVEVIATARRSCGPGRSRRARR